MWNQHDVQFLSRIRRTVDTLHGLDDISNRHFCNSSVLEVGKNTGTSRDLSVQVFFCPPIVLQCQFNRRLTAQIGVENAERVQLCLVVSADLVGSDEQLNLSNEWSSASALINIDRQGIAGHGGAVCAEWRKTVEPLAILQTVLRLPQGAIGLSAPAETHLHVVLHVGAACRRYFCRAFRGHAFQVDETGRRSECVFRLHTACHTAEVDVPRRMDLPGILLPEPIHFLSIVGISRVRKA